MITIFTMPKPFKGHISIIQRNAIQSWKMLSPGVEILLMGDEEGTPETASEFGVRHISGIKCNEYRTPLINDIFSIAQSVATNDLLCYINSDIILMKDFVRAIEFIPKRVEQFLAVGQRWDLDVTQPIDFGHDKWEEELRHRVAGNAVLQAESGIDYFIFPKGLYKNIPPFAVGRPGWDNWFVYNTRSMRVPVINLTKTVTVVHQNHDYSHHPRGFKGVWWGMEAKRNLFLAGGKAYFFTIGDADWVCDKSGELKYNFSLKFLLRQWVTFPVMFPSSRWESPLAGFLWSLLIYVHMLVSFFVYLPKRLVNGLLKLNRLIRKKWGTTN